MELLAKMEDGDAFEIDKVEGNFINLKRLRPTNCYCGGYHENQNPFIFFTGQDILFGCRRSKKKINLGSLEISTVSEISKEPRKKKELVWSSNSEIRERLSILSGKKL